MDTHNSGRSPLHDIHNTTHMHLSPPSPKAFSHNRERSVSPLRRSPSVRTLKKIVTGNQRNTSQTASLLSFLKTILQLYPNPFQVLVEFLQNADDAHARSVSVYLDERHSPVQGLVEPKLAVCQTPSVVFQDSGVFSEEDWTNIMNVGESKKNPNKIGKFGLGFNSAYHLSDVVMIISGRVFVILDPQGAFRDGDFFFDFVDSDFDGKTFKEMYPQLCQPFQAYGCNFDSEYDGTIIRLPLRQPGSRSSISKFTSALPLLWEKLFLPFVRVAEELLLFLRHVENIEVHRILPCGEDNLAFKAEIMPSIEHPGFARMESLHSLITNEDAEVLSPTEFQSRITSIGVEELSSMDKLVKIDIRTRNFTSEEGAAEDVQSQWWISNVLARGQAKTMAEKCEDALKERLIPFAQVAALVQRKESLLPAVEGHLHSFLPLSNESGWPVNINGTFSVDPARLGLNRGHITSFEDLEHAPDNVMWNRCLLADGVAHAYATLIVKVGGHVLDQRSSDNAWESYYALFPAVVKKDPFFTEELVSETYSLLCDKRVIPSSTNGGTQTRLLKPHGDQVVYIDASLFENDPETVQVMREVVRLSDQYQLVEPLEHIVKGFETCGRPLPVLDFSTLRGIVCSENESVATYIKSSVRVLSILTRYCLRAPEGINQCFLALSVDGCLQRFPATDADTPAMLLATEEQKPLLSTSEHLASRVMTLCVSDVDDEMRSRMAATAKVEIVDSQVFCSVLHHLLPSEWSGKSEVEEVDEATLPLLKEIWYHLGGFKDLQSSSFSCVTCPVLPTTRGSVIVCNDNTNVFDVAEASYLSTEERNLLENVGCRFVDSANEAGVDIHKAIKFFKQPMQFIANCIKTFSEPDEQRLSFVSDDPHAVPLDDVARKTMFAILARVNKNCPFTDELKERIKALPIFEKALSGSKDGSFTSRHSTISKGVCFLTSKKVDQRVLPPGKFLLSVQTDEEKGFLLSLGVSYLKEVDFYKIFFFPRLSADVIPGDVRNQVMQELLVHGLPRLSQHSEQFEEWVAMQKCIQGTDTEELYEPKMLVNPSVEPLVVLFPNQVPHPIFQSNEASLQCLTRLGMKGCLDSDMLRAALPTSLDESRMTKVNWPQPSSPGEETALPSREMMGAIWQLMTPELLDESWIPLSSNDLLKGTKAGTVFFLDGTEGQTVGELFQKLGFSLADRTLIPIEKKSMFRSLNALNLLDALYDLRTSNGDVMDVSSLTHDECVELLSFFCFSMKSGYGWNPSATSADSGSSDDTDGVNAPQNMGLVVHNENSGDKHEVEEELARLAIWPVHTADGVVLVPLTDFEGKSLVTIPTNIASDGGVEGMEGLGIDSLSNLPHVKVFEYVEECTWLYKRYDISVLRNASDFYCDFVLRGEHFMRMEPEERHRHVTLIMEDGLIFKTRGEELKQRLAASAFVYDDEDHVHVPSDFVDSSQDVLRLIFSHRSGVGNGGEGSSSSQNQQLLLLPKRYADNPEWVKFLREVGLVHELKDPEIFFLCAKSLSAIPSQGGSFTLKSLVQAGTAIVKALNTHHESLMESDAQFWEKVRTIPYVPYERMNNGYRAVSPLVSFDEIETQQNGKFVWSVRPVLPKAIELSNAVEKHLGLGDGNRLRQAALTEYAADHLLKLVRLHDERPVGDDGQPQELFCSRAQFEKHLDEVYAFLDSCTRRYLVANKLASKKCIYIKDHQTFARPINTFLKIEESLLPYMCKPAPALSCRENLLDTLRVQDRPVPTMFVEWSRGLRGDGDVETCIKILRELVQCDSNISDEVSQNIFVPDVKGIFRNVYTVLRNDTSDAPWLRGRVDLEKIHTLNPKIPNAVAEKLNIRCLSAAVDEEIDPDFETNAVFWNNDFTEQLSARIASEEFRNGVLRVVDDYIHKSNVAEGAKGKGKGKKNSGGGDNQDKVSMDREMLTKLVNGLNELKEFQVKCVQHIDSKFLFRPAAASNNSNKSNADGANGSSSSAAENRGVEAVDITLEKRGTQCFMDKGKQTIYVSMELADPRKQTILYTEVSKAIDNFLGQLPTGLTFLINILNVHCGEEEINTILDHFKISANDYDADHCQSNVQEAEIPQPPPIPGNVLVEEHKEMFYPAEVMSHRPLAVGEIVAFKDMKGDRSESDVENILAGLDESEREEVRQQIASQPADPVERYGQVTQIWGRSGIVQLVLNDDWSQNKLFLLKELHRYSSVPPVEEKAEEGPEVNEEEQAQEEGSGDGATRGEAGENREDNTTTEDEVEEEGEVDDLENMPIESRKEAMMESIRSEVNNVWRESISQIIQDCITDEKVRETASQRLRKLRFKYHPDKHQETEESRLMYEELSKFMVTEWDGKKVPTFNF